MRQSKRISCFLNRTSAIGDGFCSTSFHWEDYIKATALVVLKSGQNLVIPSGTRHADHERASLARRGINSTASALYTSVLTNAVGSAPNRHGCQFGRAGPYNPSPLIYGDYSYVLFDFGFLSCHDARAGQLVYDKQPIRPNNTVFTASPWAANGKIFALSEDGDTFVFQSGPDYKLLHQNSLDEMCMATPAIAGKSLNPHSDQPLLHSKLEKVSLSNWRRSVPNNFSGGFPNRRRHIFR